MVSDGAFRQAFARLAHGPVAAQWTDAPVLPGLFATLVALDYLHQGLDGARAFSSRLSTALTILVATLTVPGWMAHTLAHPTWRAARATTQGSRTSINHLHD